MQGHRRFALHAAWLVIVQLGRFCRADSLLASAPTLPAALGTVQAEPISSSEVSAFGQGFWDDKAAEAASAPVNFGAGSNSSMRDNASTELGRDALEIRERKVDQAITAATAVASLADGSLAQIPGLGDMAAPTIQAALVAYIGHVYGCYLDFAHAMSVVTWLASKYAKTYFVAKIVGYMPGVGNLIKAGVTYAMTPQIGKKAKELLSCPQGSSDFLQATSVGDSGSYGDLSNTTRRLFHTVSDYLADADMAKTWVNATWKKQRSWAVETWSRMKRLFLTQDQDELLAEISNATEAKTLSRLLRSHTWNLEVVTAVLSVLSERFALKEACIEVDYVAGRFYIPEAVNAEAREAAAPYLLLCLQRATATTRSTMAQTAAQLLVATRGGAVVGLSPLAVRQALQVLEHTSKEFAAKDPAAVASAAFAALSRGELAACGALQAILRTDAEVVAVDHLELLDRLIVPDDAESRVSALRADVVQKLTISALPSGAEVPQVESFAEARKRTGSASSASQRLEEKLSQTLVGQKCALERLTRDPGYVRLRLRGLWGQNRPLVLLLTGPSGTGKTLLSRTLGEAILDRPISDLEATGRFRTFHMNQFSIMEDQKSLLGPPKGIVGTGDLPELLKQWPDAVIVLDEVEKAHPSFARAFLKVFGENGAVYDSSTGRDISTVNATFVLTSNLGKDLISTHARSRAHTATGEDDIDCAGYRKLQADLEEALEKPRIGGHDNFFRESELRGRLTDVLPFLPFSKGEVEKAVRRFLTSEAHELAKSPVFLHATLAWSPEVVQLFAGEHARRPDQGLRGVQTQLQVQVRQVLERALEGKLLSPSCTAVLRVRGQRLDLQVVPNMAGALRAWFVDTFANRPAAGSAESVTVTSGTGSAAMGPAPAASALAASAPVASASAPSATAWSTNWVEDWQWERETQWSWTLLWEQVHDFIWEHWRTALVVSVALVAMVTMPASVATAISPAAAAGASAAVANAPAAAGAAAASAAWMPSIFAVAQFMMPVVASIPSALLMAYAWTHRHWITGLVACFMMLPAMRRAMYWGWPEVERSPSERVAKFDHVRRYTYRRANPGFMRRGSSGLRSRVPRRLNLSAAQPPADGLQEGSADGGAAESMPAEGTAQEL